MALKSRSGWILGLVLLAVVVYTMNKQYASESHPKQVSITEFLTDYAQKGKLISAEISSDNKSITGVTKNGDPKSVVADVPSWEEVRKSIVSTLAAKNVKLGVTKPSLFEGPVMAGLMTILLPVLLFGFMWIFLFRQAQNGGNQAMNFGRSRAKRLGENVPKVTFADVAGVEEAKQELGEVVEFLKNAKKFQALGAKIPKGVLLLGPPGCGKTLLARAVAGEAGVPFFHISGSDFVEMFVGVGASRVRDLFDTAKANRPSLVFIDEIDAVGRQRGAGLGGGHDEREQTLNQLLVEMDGFDPNAGVILIAATNRPDVLDPALLRPGRFDRRVTVDTPDQPGRLAILKVHAKDKPLADDVSLDTLAKRTPGFSGADLANLVNEAALWAARKEKTRIDMSDMAEAIERVVAGPQRKSRLLTDHDKEVVAYHELGHAIVGHMLPDADPIHKVTILPRGMALGYTLSMPDEDHFTTTKSELLARITMSLGGRVSEELVYDEFDTGAQSDLETASDIARRMVMEYGMSEVLGPLSLGKRHGNPFLGRDLMEERNYGEEVASAIDKEVRNIIDECYAEARRILVEHRPLMDRVKDVLLERETIEKEEFETLMAGGTLPDRPLEPPTAPPAPLEPERRQDPVKSPRFRPEPA